MGIPQEQIEPRETLLIFTRRSISSVGSLTLPVNIYGIIWNLDFLIIDAPSSYNGIMRCPALKKIKASVSTYLATVEIQTSSEIHTIMSNRHIGHECS